MLRARSAVSVAVITSAALGRRLSSRPVGFAVGDVGFPFACAKVGRDALRISPTCILDRLWGGESRDRAENEANNRHRCVPQFHGTPHRGACCPGVLSHNLSDQLATIFLGRVKSLYRHGYTIEAFGGKFAKIKALESGNLNQRAISAKLTKNTPARRIAVTPQRGRSRRLDRGRREVVTALQK